MSHAYHNCIIRSCLHILIIQYRFQSAFTDGLGVFHTFHHSYLLTHFSQLHQSTTLLLPTREEAVYPGISGASGSFCENLSSSLLNVSILHPFRSLMFLGSEIKSFTDCTKKIPSLIVFSWVDAVRLKRESLRERPVDKWFSLRI